MAAALIERIEIDADRHIDIRFKYRDEYLALTSWIEGRERNDGGNLSSAVE